MCIVYLRMPLWYTKWGSMAINIILSLVEAHHIYFRTHQTDGTANAFVHIESSQRPFVFLLFAYRIFDYYFWLDFPKTVVAIKNKTKHKHTQFEKKNQKNGIDDLRIFDRMKQRLPVAVIFSLLTKQQPN